MGYVRQVGVCGVGVNALERDRLSADSPRPSLSPLVLLAVVTGAVLDGQLFSLGVQYFQSELYTVLSVRFDGNRLAFRRRAGAELRFRHVQFPGSRLGVIGCP